MLDLSEELDEENIDISMEYFKRLSIKIWLEMKIRITGGEEDRVYNKDIDPKKLYTTPEQVYTIYNALSRIGPVFSIAAAFGNVHGIYKPTNVKLSPERLGGHQTYAKRKLSTNMDKPIFLVMYSGSGSTDDKIQCAVDNGIVKINVNTNM